MSKEAYRKKLLDPRWQKKRLEVLNRDEFTCQLCGDTEETLHVHHKRYVDGDPWDISKDALVTLCATCHEEEGDYLSDSMKYLTTVTRDRFSAEEVWLLAQMLEGLFTADDWNKRVGKQAGIWFAEIFEAMRK